MWLCPMPDVPCPMSTLRYLQVRCPILQCSMVACVSNYTPVGAQQKVEEEHEIHVCICG